MKSIIKHHKLTVLATATCAAMAMYLTPVSTETALANVNAMYPKCRAINGEECKDGEGPITCEKNGEPQTCTCKKKPAGYRWSCSGAAHEVTISTPLDDLDDILAP